MVTAIKHRNGAHHTLASVFHGARRKLECGPRILDRVAKRIFPLLLVLAVAGAPIAAQLCEMTCVAPAEHAGMAHHATPGSGQSCHEPSAAGGPQMAAIPHACGHDAEGQAPAASLSDPQNGTAAIPLALVSASAMAFDGCPSLIVSSPHSQAGTRPTPVRSVMPLRI